MKDKSMMSYTILDSGATHHVFNCFERFRDFTYFPSDQPTPIQTGGGTKYLIGKGTVFISLLASKTTYNTLKLRDVYFCPDFPCNIVSAAELEDQLIYWDMEHRTLRHNNIVIGIVPRQGKLYILENVPPSSAANYTTLLAATTNRRTTADLKTWHARLGHPGDLVQRHFPGNVTGMNVTSFTKLQDVCTTCQLSKAKRQSSNGARRSLKEPGERLAVDFHDFEQSANIKSCVLITDMASGFTWDYYLPDRTAATICACLEDAFRLITNHLSASIKIVEADQEIVSVKPAVRKWIESQGISLEPSAPYAPEQNGGAEANGQTIKTKARTLAVHSGVPMSVWPETMRAAVFLHNRTPSARRNFTTPYYALFKEKPDVSFLRVYGCKAFALTRITQRMEKKLSKLDPKAWVGFLVGYNASNIFRIWNPQDGKISITRDVVFDEFTLFRQCAITQSSYSPEPFSQQLHPDAVWPQYCPPSAQIPTDLDEPRQTSFEEPPDPNAALFCMGYLSEPVAFPDPAFACYTLTTSVCNPKILRTTSPQTWQYACLAASSKPLTFRRQHIATTTATADELMQHKLANTLHQDNLPSIPRTVAEARRGPLASDWEKAMTDHLATHQSANSWTVIEPDPTKVTIDSKWVYTYKFDEKGSLLKFKARLVARGDQVRNVFQETFAATLAIRSLRTILAIASQRSMTIKQYDVSNAYMNADLPEPVYMKQPPGFRTGKILRLNKALYGLPQSGHLWQNLFISKIDARRFNLTQIKHDVCIFVGPGIILFYYIDDFNIAYEPEQTSLAESIINNLRKSFTITGGEDIHWYLGIEITKLNDGLTLSQKAYAEKLTKGIESSHVDTPLPTHTVPLPNTARATPREINKYQKIIGGLLWLSLITRPDIAFAVSLLSRFASNPSQEHFQMLNHILSYVKNTVHYALIFPNTFSKSFQLFTDSSYADDPVDRHSSQGILLKLFGAPLFWRASKQSVVTTSSTEAELLALSHGTKEAKYQCRLFEELHLHIPKIRAFCDNAQTLNIINKNITALNSGIKHIDVHNHWLRGEAASGTVEFLYIPTHEQEADGFTKQLPSTKHKKFMRQIPMSTEHAVLPQVTIDVDVCDR